MVGGIGRIGQIGRAGVKGAAAEIVPVIHEGLMAGAAAGSPGSLPTGSTQSGGTGTYAVASAAQVVDNVECFDVTISGGFCQFMVPLGYGGVNAVQNDQFGLDVYLQVLSGALTGFGLTIYEIDTGYGYLTEHTISPSVPNDASLDDCLRQHSATLANAAVARTNGVIYLDATVSATVRLSYKFFEI